MPSNPPEAVPEKVETADRRAQRCVPVADELAATEQTPPVAEARLESLPRGTLNRQVFILALPMLGEQFVNFFVGMVDTLLAGRVSKEATGAVGTAGYMSWFVTLAFIMFATGASVLVARSFGARDTRTANRAMNQSVLLAFCLGPLVSAVVYLLAPAAAAFLTQTQAAADLFVTYLRIDAFGYTLYSIVLVGGGVVRAAGDTRTPMAIMIVVNIVNIVVSATLCFGWLGEPLGVIGIAIGTVTARSLGGLLMAGVLFRGLHGLKLQARLLVPHRETIRRMLRVGLPAGADASIMWIAQLAFIWIVSRTAVGDAATANYAAHMIAMRMEAITYLPAVAWMTASATLVGQYLGAQQPEKAARAGHIAALQGAILTTGVGVAFFLLADLIYAVLSNDPAVRAAGVAPFKVMAFIQPFLCVAIIYTGSLRGAGDTRTTMIFSIIGGLALRVPIAWLFGVYLGYGLIGAWIGMWCDNLAKFALCGARFAHGGWKSVKV